MAESIQKLKCGGHILKLASFQSPIKKAWTATDRTWRRVICTKQTLLRPEGDLVFTVGPPAGEKMTKNEGLMNHSFHSLKKTTPPPTPKTLLEVTTNDRLCADQRVRWVRASTVDADGCARHDGRRERRARERERDGGGAKYEKWLRWRGLETIKPSFVWLSPG